MSKRIGRPSPALIISIVALVAALGGGAYAATVAKNSVSAKSLKKNAVVTNKIKNAAVTKDKLADGAVTAEKIADPSLTIRAYAKVNQGGGAIASQSKNIGPIDHTQTGRYCFDLSFTPNSVMAVTRGDDAAGDESAQPVVPAPTCPAGFQDAAVFVSTDAAAADGGFFVWFN